MSPMWRSCVRLLVLSGTPVLRPHSRSVIASGTIWGFALASMVALGSAAFGQPAYDLNTQWSNSFNPNGAWTYREGSNALPAVAAWQSGGLGGWTVAQPGWSDSENGTDRIPFWYRSNGSEIFDHDFLAGDVVVHSTDSFNGIGNGPANVVWISPFNGVVDINGGTWIGREIGRGNRWNIYHGATLLSTGETFSGDAFSRASPFNFGSGSGGTNALVHVPVTMGDTIRLEIVAISAAGDFQGINFSVDAVGIGDFDQNGLFNCLDVDALVSQIASGQFASLYDLTGDGSVNAADLTQWLTLAGAANLPSGHPYLPGDANLNGSVDGSDFGIWNSHKFTSIAAWCSGDFTADGVVDGSDFGVWNSHKFTSSDSAIAVPEPMTLVVWAELEVLGLISVALRQRRWRLRR